MIVAGVAFGYITKQYIMLEFQNGQLSSWPGHERNGVTPQAHLRVFL